MDILLISRCPPFPPSFGDRLILYHLARELSGRRHRIDLLAFYDNPADIAEIPRYEQYFTGVTLIREPRRTLTSYLQRSRRPKMVSTERRAKLVAGDVADHRTPGPGPGLWRSCSAAQVTNTCRWFGCSPTIVPYLILHPVVARRCRKSATASRAWSQMQRLAQQYESWMFEVMTAWWC
jgi:hypothetical protein